MRVLHLTTEFPWPPTSGGMVRTVSQLRILASLPEVEAISTLAVSEEDVPDLRRQAFTDAFPKLRVLPPVFHPVHLFEFKRYLPRVVLLRALRGVPYLAGKWDSGVFRRALRRELRAAPVDVVYIDHLGMAQYLDDVKRERPTARVVLDQHNLESDFFGQFARKQTGVKKLIAEMEHRASVGFEKKILGLVDAVVAISDQDAKHFASLAGVRPHVVPVVMKIERKKRPEWRGPARFCYVGNLRWLPNVAGLDWFCREVWPLVRARLPEATLEIAGVGLTPDASGRLPVPEGWKVPGVETVGFLENLEPLYARSIAMLAPVLGGSGVRMKLLEGFRAGMPVVTTPDGAVGLPITDGKEALIAADPSCFADRMERLARDRASREALREAGYRYLESRHSLAAAQDVMRRVLGVP